MHLAQPIFILTQLELSKNKYLTKNIIQVSQFHLNVNISVGFFKSSSSFS